MRRSEARKRQGSHLDFTGQQAQVSFAVEQGMAEAEFDFVPVSQDWLMEEPFYEEYEAYADSIEEIPHSPLPIEQKKRPFPLVSLLMIGLSLIILVSCFTFILNASGSQEAFNQKLKAMQGNQFFDGIQIDQSPVGGQSPLDLRVKARQQAANGQPLDIQVTIDRETYFLTQEHLHFENNLESVMEEAWSIGRQGTISIINSQFTPFEVRYRQAQHVKKNGASFYTKATYKNSEVTRIAEQIATAFNREPVNAVVASFDFKTKAFSVTQDVQGRHIEAQAIKDALASALDRGDYTARISLSGSVLLPKVSSVEMTNSFTRLSTYSTKTGSNRDRNNNIALAALAISNQTLMPGQTFSFNQTTGQRTLEKGYAGAPAISGGVLIDDVGGGVCQVSSTLFFAAAQADMGIVERSPHAWPVSYMDKGLDATVNWPNLDFQFKNNKDTPVFIIASYENKTLTVEFYGMQSAPGEKIELVTELISTTKPPREPIYQQNPNLPLNSQKELKQERTGYVVDTYRVYLRNGNEIRREKLFTSKYREVQQVIEFN